MSVTNVLLQQVPVSEIHRGQWEFADVSKGLLAPNGRFYLVAVQQNKPDEIVTKMTSLGLQCKVSPPRGSPGHCSASTRS